MTVSVCGMRCIDLNNNMLKILGTHFSWNKKLNKEKKIKTLHKMYPNTEFFLVCIWPEYRDLFVNLCIQTEYKKIRTRKSSLFGYFSRSETVTDIQ